MKQELIKFNFESFEVRTITSDNGDPWFVAKDVCAVLGYSNSRDALLTHLENQEKGVARIDTLGGKQEVATINESGLYALILRSNKPEAKKFRLWVTSEVLPSIRKTGSYYLPAVAPTQPSLPTDIDASLAMISQMALALLETRKEVKAIEVAQSHQGQVQLAQAEIQQYQATEITEIKQHTAEIRRFAETGSYLEGYFTVMRWYIAYKVKTKDDGEIKRIGILCSKMCKERGIFIDKVPHPKYNRINAYPESVIAEVVMYKDDLNDNGMLF